VKKVDKENVKRQSSLCIRRLDREVKILAQARGKESLEPSSLDLLRAVGLGARVFSEVLFGENGNLVCGDGQLAV